MVNHKPLPNCKPQPVRNISDKWHFFKYFSWFKFLFFISFFLFIPLYILKMHAWYGWIIIVHIHVGANLADFIAFDVIISPLLL